MALNTPDTRQDILAERLTKGAQLVAVEVAQEFHVSVDTIRRDILSLESAGLAQRVRGGAIPIRRPALPLHQRLDAGPPPHATLLRTMINQIGDAATLLIDGGTTTLSLAAKLHATPDRLVMTPSPWIAIACQEKGIPVHILGGLLRPQGGIATGDSSISAVHNIAADIAIIGACGIDESFGVSSDDFAESQMKRAMHFAATRTFVLADHTKLNQRARHRTLALAEIDRLITDAPPHLTQPLVSAGAHVVTP